MVQRFLFRQRFEVAQGRRLGIQEGEFVLHDDTDVVVWLRAITPDRSLMDSDTWLLLGAAFQSEDEAVAAGWHWRGVLERAFAVLSMGADFGDYAPKGGGFSKAARDQMEAASGHPVLNETYGVMALQDDPRAIVVSGSARGVAVTSTETFRVALFESANAPVISSAERLAFDVYSAAQFVADFPAPRLIMLMSALEVLIDVNRRDAESIDHLDRLIEITAASDLDRDESEKLRSALSGLKNESITAAARRLASDLHGRLYDGMSPEEFFNHCYKIRSALVHGAPKRPSRDDVGRAAASLELFVGHLIAGRDVVDAVLPHSADL